VLEVKSLFYGCKNFVSFDKENILVIWEFNKDSPLKVLHFGFSLSSISLISLDNIISGIYATDGNNVLNLQPELAPLFE